LLAFLKSKATELRFAEADITSGRYGELPSNVPCLWLFTEPEDKSDSESLSAFGLQGEAYITAVCADHFDANEACEKIMSYTLPVRVRKCSGAQFEGVFGDYAVVSITLTFMYEAIQ
jgi:hypothetical protein